MGNTIRFILNGETVEISNLPPATTLLNWLRYQRHLTGTNLNTRCPSLILSVAAMTWRAV